MLAYANKQTQKTRRQTSRQGCMGFETALSEDFFFIRNPTFVLVGCICLGCSQTVSSMSPAGSKFTVCSAEGTLNIKRKSHHT